ncbi:MAG: hypothetical protein GYB68_13465, partial [Chloroflexi bacterium]|nr:hypothetical protein [Chloroflexota bacterium]
DTDPQIRQAVIASLLAQGPQGRLALLEALAQDEDSRLLVILRSNLDWQCDYDRDFFDGLTALALDRPPLFEFVTALVDGWALSDSLNLRDRRDIADRLVDFIEVGPVEVRWALLFTLNRLGPSAVTAFRRALHRTDDPLIHRAIRSSLQGYGAR